MVILIGTAHYRSVLRSLLGYAPLLVTVRTVQIQFPWKGHTFPSFSLGSAISGERYRILSRRWVTIRYKVDCD